MAKMFYTLEEVCEKLGRNEDEIKEMVKTGQIQEFRDRDKLMFKVEQIDLLASGEEDTSDVHLELEDTSGGSSMALKDESAIGLADSREGTGVSVFDTDHGGEEGEQTRSGDAIEEELGLDAVGSGSGLLDLTRESDDTSLGAELLEEVYSSEENVEIPAAASGLFEAASAEKPGEEVAVPVGGAAMPMVIEAYDGGGSGLGAGLLIGALVALICVAIIGIVGTSGATSVLAAKIASSSNSVWMWAGGLLGVTVVLGLIGLFIGKASE
ncbi:MAG: helix-turn-helix domain-containing protein [Planctomycetota bacterium]|jgi:hypothetical protein